MNLLYATSITYPSPLANRQQTLEMANAFSDLLGNTFTLGIYAGNPPGARAKIVQLTGSLRSPIRAWSYLRLIKREGYTHVYCREYKLLAFMRLYSYVFPAKTKFIFEIHVLHSDPLFWVAVGKSHAVVGTTEASLRDTASFRSPSTPVCVARNGIDMSRFPQVPDAVEARRTLVIPEGSLVVAYVGSFGRYNSWKGIEIFLDAARLLPDYIFLAVGARENERSDFSARYPMRNVRIHDAVAPKEIPQILAAADMLVLPNRSDSKESAFYTSPLKLFEYMASGVPIISSDLPSIREIVSEEDVFFFKAGDYVSLADAIRAVVADLKAARKRAENAKRNVAQYTWAARARAIIELMNRI